MLKEDLLFEIMLKEYLLFMGVFIFIWVFRFMDIPVPV